jgi:WD40 repeat protein
VPAAPGQDAERFRRYEIFHDVLAPTINRVIEARDLQRRARRRSRFLIFTIYILVIITTLAGLFALETLKAKNETSLAESHQLTAAGDLNLGTDPELSTLLALQALHTAYTRQAEDTLRTALPEMQGIRTLRNGSLVSSAVFDPADNDLVASTDLTGRASIWDVRTGRQLVRTSVGGSAGSANAVAFNPAGTEVAVGYEDGDIALFDVATGKSLALVADGAAPINDVQFLGDTGTLAIASQQNLALWQPNEGITTLLSVPALRIGVNPRRPREFAVVSSAGVVIVNRGGSPVRSLATQGPGITVNDAEFSPDGGKVVAADSNGKVYVYDLSRRNAPPAVLDAGELSADSAAFSPDGSQVVASYSSGTARVWDLATGLQETVLAGGASEVVTADKDGTIRIWYTRPRELRTAFTIPAGGRTPPPVVGAYYIAGRIAAYDKRGYLRVFTADGRQQAVLPVGAALAAAAWDSTGTRALTATANGTITLWQAAGTAYVKVKLAVACEDGTIRVFGASSAQLLTELQATRTGAVTDAAFSPDGQSIVAGIDAGNTGYVQVWNAELSTGSLTAQEQMAEARVTQQLTQAQVQHYLNDASS